MHAASYENACLFGLGLACQSVRPRRCLSVLWLDSLFHSLLFYLYTARSSTPLFPAMYVTHYFYTFTFYPFFAQIRAQDAVRRDHDGAGWLRELLLLRTTRGYPVTHARRDASLTLTHWGRGPVLTSPLLSDVPLDESTCHCPHIPNP